jgi:hypothetical protein
MALQRIRSSGPVSRIGAEQAGRLGRFSQADSEGSIPFTRSRTEALARTDVPARAFDFSPSAIMLRAINVPLVAPHKLVPVSCT